MRASDSITETCAAASLDLGRIAADGSAWLFGSRASGCAAAASDWDLLVLTPHAKGFRRECIDSLDVVTVGWSSAHTDHWLASELAAHVARYGQLLIGGDDWTYAIDTNEASRRKTARTCGRITAVGRAWPNLNERYRRERAITLRRDIQRALALAGLGTVPPTFFLDQEWAAASRRERARLVDRLDGAMPPELRRALITNSVPGHGEIDGASQTMHSSVIVSRRPQLDV